MATPKFNKYDLLVHDGADASLPESIKAVFIITAISALAIQFSSSNQTLFVGFVAGIIVAFINFLDNDLRSKLRKQTN